MPDVVLHFRTGDITIDCDKCKTCRAFACVKACSLFGTNILRIEDGLPSPIPSLEEFPRRCNECLACEMYCEKYGARGLRATVLIEGLDEAKTSVGETEVA